MIERLLLALAQWIAGHYGFSVVRATPVSLLPSRVEALRVTVRKSGHLARRYNVRGTLERKIADVDCLVSELAPTSRETAVASGVSA